MIGQKFGNYVATGLLGEGGMGSVYLAEHPSIGRRVAIKVLRPEFNRNAELLGRFLNEARAANAIRHPNIIEILDSGTIENGAPYLVLELLEGESVSGRIARLGRLSIPEAVEFAYQTASALGAAHKKRIVHRDLKPDNLFIVPDPSDSARERIKVLDFGIAKLAQQDAGDSVKTRTGTLMGTPVYMSPEQCLGTKEVDYHSDIYSLGIIIYEMLCGQTPFISTGFGELVTMHLAMQPRPPRDLNPAVTEDLQAVVLKCLEKRPEDRYDSMNELQLALKTAGGPSVTVRGASSPNLNGGTIPSINGNAGNKSKTSTEPHTARRALGLGETLAQGVAPTTTFSGVASEKKSIFKPKRSSFLMAAAVAAGLAGLLAFKVMGSKEVLHTASTTTQNTAAPPQTQTVTLSLSSQPMGAAVIRNSDHSFLGQTPLDLQMPVSTEPMQLTFRLEGFAEVVRALAVNQNMREDIVLSALPVHEKAPVAEPSKPQIARPKRTKPVVDPEEPAKL